MKNLIKQRLPPFLAHNENGPQHSKPNEMDGVVTFLLIILFVLLACINFEHILFFLKKTHLLVFVAYSECLYAKNENSLKCWFV